jgi:hypothetical protein
VKHVAAFLVCWITLWWTWQLLVGEWGRYQWVAGAIAATIGAALGELAATRARAHARVPWAIVKSAPAALGMVFVDFATVTRDIFLRREGVFRTRAFQYPDDEAHRAWAMVVADYSPNAYVIEITDGETLTHHLTPRTASQEPA